METAVCVELKAPSQGIFNGGRLPALDGLRGIAVALVVSWHYFFANLLLDPRTHKYALPFALNGTGVDLFFVLSGFLLTNILLENRDSPNYYKAFYARRAFRILPLYWAVFLPFAAF